MHERATRDEEISKRFVAGETYEEIGRSVGLTRERVRQIIYATGLRRTDGGAALKAARKRLVYRKKVNENSLRLLGITKDEVSSIKAEYGKEPFRAFYQQRQHSIKRGIHFLFTFPVWWKTWLDSGRWDDRGLHDGRMGYVMARHGDQGAYEPSNVKIIPAGENSREAQANRWARAKSREAALHV